MVSIGILYIPIVTAFFYWNNLLWCYVFAVLTVSCFFLGCLIVMFINIALSPKHQTGASTLKTVAEMDAFHNLLLKGYVVKTSNTKKHIRYPMVFSRMVDGALQNLLDLVFQDFVGRWLSELAFNSVQIVDNMKQDVWGAIQSLHDRLLKVDHTKLVVCNIVNKITFHFEKIRIAQAASSEGEDPVFILSAHLMSPAAELGYLRKLGELYILFLLPRCYSLSPMKYLLREILACKILKPAIDLITDPDYINQKILSYIDQQQLAEAMHRKTYEYAESFEDFIRMIKSSKDLEVLKHIRYNIVTEIMQATTIQNVKRAQGLGPDNNAFGKSDIIQARKLTRYISQLTYAKDTCERHMQSLGWNGYPVQTSDVPDSVITEEKILPLQYILDNVIGRRYLSQFLEQVASQDLIGYWAAVQELRSAEKSNWHQLGAEIFYTYITSPTAEIKVDRTIRKKMESFLLGDMGPNVFYEVQDSVVKTLEEKYYPSFVVSEQYRNMQEALLNERTDDLVDSRRMVNGALSENVTLLVGEHSNYARSKLDQLQEKLSNNMQALQALRSSLKPESKVLNFLAKEVEWLQCEKRQLEAHLTHTETWAEHLGHWRAQVQKGEDPVFILSAHLMSPAAELGYLRKLGELYILFLLPRCYSLSPMKYLLREILACKILKPAIDLITDPDYINQKILSYIDQQQLAEAMHRKTYEYAESFEDFIRMIKSSKDLEVLKHIRYNIVTEIMQATTIQNVKRAQGLGPDNNAFGKSDIIQARKLTRYISQLTYAKDTCERHMQSLGWNGYPVQASDVPDSVITEEKILPLQYILDNVIGRRYLSQFLEQVASQDLIGYWAAVQELRSAEKSNWHQLGAEIFYTYITSPTAEIKVDRTIRKKMESFLLGDMGPNVFYEVQDSVVKTLEEKYYPSFVVSEQYRNMQEALLNERTDDLVDSRRMVNGALSENVTLLVGEHSNYARSKLDQLQEKLSNNMQALQALRSSLKPESKVLNFLAKEVEWLQCEKRQLEAHLTHTETWAEHLGHWRAQVQKGEDPVFILSAHLMSPAAELGYLRKLGELYILFLLPRCYSLSPMKYLLREILACKILKPAIDLITDPDYINQKILSYIDQQQLAEAMHRKTYEYAESFEDFIRMIKSSKDLEVLKHIRYNIVTEIMQATTIQNVKRAQGLGPDNNAFGKSDIIQARKLTRYISQLTYAKDTCERHMQSLGWNGYPVQASDVPDSVITEEKILPLQYILDNVIGRRYLSQFLEQVASQDLIGYWAAVQELRSAEKSNWHQLGAEIFYTYITSPTAEIKVDRTIRKKMESFLLGDMGPNVFYEVQDSVVKTLEEKYYPSFVVSEQYRNMQEALLNERTDDLVDSRRMVNGALSENVTLLVGEHSNYARSKLDQLQEKLSNNMQALQALRSSLKPESKVLNFLAKEVEWLQCEKRQLEAHLTHTETWAEHLGHWRAQVQKGEDPVFILSAHLMSPAAELGYLRKLGELYILFLLPRCYSLSPMKYLLREILACKILKPAIDLITDPDYINQKILSYIDQQQLAEAMHRKTYEYAESFEDFIRMIKSSKDLEVLKHIRYNIVTEIMQATTIQNVKRAQGLGPDNNAFGKSDIIQARKLTRYISQLTYAKDTCERHMQSLGWNGYPVQASDVPDSVITEEKILPLQYILDNVIGRRYLSQFLEQVASQDLIGYWAAVQELRSAEKSNWHQLGAEIFYTYITSPTAEIKVDRTIRKKMESFLLGDMGPNVFYEVQDSVVKTLEEKYYPSFVVSEQYRNMQEALLNERTDDLVDSRRMVNGALSENVTLLVGEHSNYARSKLDQLQEKLSNKMQALQALRSSLKPESKVLNFLAKAVEWLQCEKRQLEAHLTHTETWAEHLGHWRAEVQSAEIPENGETPQFVLVVHMAEDEDNNDSICSGWVVLRRLQDFQDLHRKLRQLCSNVKNLDLPSQPLKFFGKSDKNSLDKAKIQIQKYINYVLEDEKLNQSEALYTFLSPSSEHLKYAPPSPKKSRFSLSTLFKTSSNSSELRDKEDEEDYSLLLDDTDTARSTTDAYLIVSKDAIAEPLYTLLGEIFDLRGVFRFLRRSLITFVQITYGRTINRQIRDTITWVFSEPMLHYYIQLFTKSWWPNGYLVSETVIRTDEEKLKTRGEARRQFLSNIPEVLTNLVGAQSAQRGAIKIFDSLQNTNLNKQLFYDIFEAVMFEVFPELPRIQPIQ